MEQPPHQLDYTIHSCSNCSPTYHPFTILEDTPTEPSSRWSGSGPPHPASRPLDPQKPNNLEPKVRCISPESDRLLDSQLNSISSAQPLKKKDYIIIDLGKPCIVRSITFGKFHRPHPCNIKLFRIWGSLAPGEGQGDFRALLDSQPIENDSLHNHPPHPSFKYPSQSNLHQNQLSKKVHNSIDLYDQPNYASEPPFYPIRARGERHRAGPRMELLAQGELKNDTVPETVPLRWKNHRVPWFKSANNFSSAGSTTHHPDSQLSNQTVIVPIRYIKIEPLSAAGSNYNCSIWHISVKGHDQDHILRPCLENYEQWRAAAAIRLCLKHLRQTGHFEAFQALLKSSANPSQSPLLVPPPSDCQSDPTTKSLDPLDQAEGSSKMSSHSARFHFEHSLVSELHSALVSKSEASNEFDRPLRSTSNNPIHTHPALPPISGAEQIVIQAASQGLFDQWARAEPPSLTCEQIRQPPHSLSDVPGPRGGHQMCIDSKRRKIWLFGGFDGYRDLGDLWVYHLEPFVPSAQEDEAPTSGCRNEQKPTEGYAETSSTNTGVKYNTWQLIAHDVKQQDDGPSRRSCHKMVLDETTGDLYVMGRYIERSLMGENEASDSTEGTTNGNLFISPDRLSVQTVRISNNLLDADNHAEVEATTNEAAAPDVGDGLSLDETPPPAIDIDDMMISNGENLFQPPQLSGSPPGNFKNDFFRFQPFEHPSSDKFLQHNGRIGRWECLSQDTYAENGPKLVFDHQMVLDAERRKIYLFGGKIIQPIFIPSQDPPGSASRSNLIQYSGLFEYDLSTRTWTQLMADPGSATTESPTSGASIPSRMGHSLILDKKRDCLWILTGERDNHYYSDIWRYDITERRVTLVVGDYTYGGRHVAQSSEYEEGHHSAPEAGFSQRITFDPDLDEWHMFCGLCKDRGASSLDLPSSSKLNLKSQIMSSEFWRWRIQEGSWTQVVMKNHFNGMHSPLPRFAHQMVFDTLTKTHYVFGGNPADNDNEPTRLGDFWKLKLIQPTRTEALRRCLFGLRRQHFIEMCQEGTDTAGALWYLQNDLSSVTKHLDEREGRLFRACTRYLLAGPGPRMALSLDDDPADCAMDHDHHDPPALDLNGDSVDNVDGVDVVAKRREQRLDLFHDLLRFFPASVTQPSDSLIDLIDTWGNRETFW